MSDIFPGTKINNNTKEIVSNILKVINPKNLKPIENVKTWIRVDEKIYESDMLLNNKDFYLLYKHPVHEYLDKLFEVSRDELIDFMKDRIYPDKEEGIDIIVSTKNFSRIIVCNHDGEIYQV